MSYPHPDPKPQRPRRKPEYIPSDPLLTAKEAAAETGRAVSTFWRDVRAGKLPGAFYITPKTPRWRLSELRAAVDATRTGTRAADLQSAA